MAQHDHDLQMVNENCRARTHSYAQKWWDQIHLRKKKLLTNRNIMNCLSECWLSFTLEEIVPRIPSITPGSWVEKILDIKLSWLLLQLNLQMSNHAVQVTGTFFFSKNPLPIGVHKSPNENCVLVFVLVKVKVANRTVHVQHSRTISIYRN